MQKQTAKTPTVAIARVLRGLGLVQGADFRVKTKYKGSGANRERIGTHVAVLSKEADQIIADNADFIEEMVKLDGGWVFNVSIHFTTGGRVWTWVANYGSRTRDTHFLSDIGRVSKADYVTRYNRPPEDIRSLDEAKKSPFRATLGEPRPAFDQKPDETQQEASASRWVCPAPPLTVKSTNSPVRQEGTHPYDGKVTRHYGALTWACETAGKVWFFQKNQHSPRYTLTNHNGGAKLSGWYLTGLGVDPDGIWMGLTLSEAAKEAYGEILAHEHLAERVESATRRWPKGTRVQGLDTYGVLCNGTVHGATVGVVLLPGHENYGRIYADVAWDTMPHSAGTGRRSMSFLDKLVQI